MKKSVIAGAPAFVAATLAAVAAAGCAATDIVAKVANTSFKAVAEASADRLSWSGEDQSWILGSPAGDQVSFSSDFSRNSSDSALSFDAAPFVAAGLDIGKLPEVAGIEYALEEGRLKYRFELGGDKFSSEAAKSLEATFAEIVRTERARIGYHEKLDHYGIKLGGGNMFEWAKDMTTNDKDIVFVLDPEPFIAAGLDPAKIAGWVFAKVEVKDDAGKAIQVDKLLRPYNLK